MNGNIRSERLCRPPPVRRTITVDAESELLCSPDQFSLLVSVSSIKESAEAAQNSVQRRTQYILQVLRNHGMRDKNVETTTHVSRSGKDGSVTVRVDIRGNSDDAQSCETARNLILTKMDASVHCSVVEPSITSTHRTEIR